MSVNALIAQGGRPVGSGLPQVANMLAQRDQQNLQNERAATQDQYIAEEHQQGRDTTLAKQVLAETEHFIRTPPKQWGQLADIYPHVAEQLKNLGIDIADPNAVPAIKVAVLHAHDKAQSFLGQGPEKPPAPISVAPDATLVQPPTPGDDDQSYKPIYTGAPKPVPLQSTETGLTFNSRTGKYMDSSGRELSSSEVASRAAQVAGQRTAATAAASEKAKMNQFPPGSMDYAVEYALQHGGSPPPGSRGAQFMAQFGIAMKAKALQDNNSMAAQIADARIKESLKPAMAQTEKQIAANSGFLQTLEMNIAAADKLAQSVGGTGSPAMNDIFNKWKRHITGDPNVKALDFWNNAIQGESAKIATGGVGSVGASSDAQIEKQVRLMNTADNYAGWRSAADAAIQEGKNRMAGLGNTMQMYRSQSMGATPAGGIDMPGAPPAPAAATPPTNAKGWKLYSDKNGNKAYVSPDGKQYEAAQ